MPAPINHVMIPVADLAASVAFYRDRLGLELMLETTLSGPALAAMIRADGPVKGRMALLRGRASKVGQVELIEWSPAAAPAESTDLRTLGRPMLSFDVDTDAELLALHAKLRSEGCDVWSDPQRFELPGYGFMHAFLVSDPDETAVEFVRLPTRDEVKAYLAGSAR